MLRVVGICLLFVSLGLKASDGDAIHFLTAIDLARDSDFDTEDAETEYQISLKNEAKEDRLFEILQELYDQEAVTEDEYREGMNRRDVSKAKTKVWKAKRDSYAAEAQQQHYQSEIAAGKKLDVSKLYEDYVRYWESQCALFRSEATLSRAVKVLAQFRLDIARKLHPKSVVTTSELLQKEMDLLSAERRLEKFETRDRSCSKTVPSLEIVERVAKR